MFSKRILSFLLLLVSFGLFASASPVINEDGGVSVRSLVPDAPDDLVEHLERRGGFPRKPCHCPRDLHDVVVSLQETVTVHIQELDGKKDFHKIIVKIVEKIKVTITLIERISIHGCSVTVVIKICVEIIVKIIVDICAGLHKYPIKKIKIIIEEITTIHIQLVQSCTRICPHIFVVIKETVKVHVSVVRVLPHFCKYLGV